MRVESEPRATALREILEELLAPHGLVSRDGPEGTVVVVPRSAPASAARSSVGGFVRSRRDATPIAGASIRIAGGLGEARSGPDGAFTIADAGPGTLALEARAESFLAARLEGVEVPPGRHVEVTLLLEPAALIEDELVVTPSRLSLLRETPGAPLAMSRDEILSLPHLGDDFFRALTLLPGTAGNDVTAQFHVRGGRRDETQILIDGQELYEAFHLKDFDSALSFVAPTTLGGADLTTGGFPVRFGDRMSGVLEMTTLRPSSSPRFRVGAGVLSLHAGGGGTFRDDRGSWLAEIRRGSIDLVARLLGDEDPKYWDAFGKVDYRLGDAGSLRANVLRTGDELEFEEVTDENTKRFETGYSASYLWLTHQALVGSDLLVETAASISSADRDRRGIELEEDVRFAIVDARDFEVGGLRQDWSFQPTARHGLEWGWEARDFDTEYDYTGTRDFDNPLARIRHDFGTEATDFRRRLHEDHDSLYLADRFRWAEPLTLELGLRYDKHSQTRESRVSPRFNLAWSPGGASVMRLAWGRFNQSQRPHELLVEDGDTAFYPVERSEHRVVGYERLFGTGAAQPGLALRVELYQRIVDNPRPRYENLYEPINTFPEVEPDRVKIAGDRSVAEGLELFLRGRIGRRIGWWINYTLASTEDRVEGRWVPRPFDQTHTLNLDLDIRFEGPWRINLAWRYHTGWPTTPLGLRETVDDEGEILFVPLLGPINSDRMPDYHRLDLRASRRWRWRSATLDLYVDVQNVYDRKNAAGFDVEIDEEQGSLQFGREDWAAFFPSAGISVEF